MKNRSPQQNRPHSPRPSSGFTLIELVIVLIILGVIAAVAARPIANFLEAWISIGDETAAQAEEDYELERVSRNVRKGSSDGCDEIVSCEPDPNDSSIGDIIKISINDEDDEEYQMTKVRIRYMD